MEHFIPVSQVTLYKGFIYISMKYLDGFTKRYGCKKLVYYEQCNEMIDAIAREKQIKAGSRKKKLALIERMNPNWEDLYESFMIPGLLHPQKTRVRNDGG